MKNAGVYKTIDGGLSWRPAHHGLANTHVKSLLIDSRNPRNPVRRHDRWNVQDARWRRELVAGSAMEPTCLMDLQDNSHLYARDENGIYETTGPRQHLERPCML